MAELTKPVKQLQATVEKQGKELARLKAKSKPTSRNSSIPQSADPNRKRASKGPSSRKQRGQPGHKGHSSKPLLPDEVFAVNRVPVRAAARRSLGTIQSRTAIRS